MGFEIGSTASESTAVSIRLLIILELWTHFLGLYGKTKHENMSAGYNYCPIRTNEVWLDRSSPREVCTA